jgi:hypothetical protein
MTANIKFLSLLVIAMSLFAFACTRTLEGQEATKALDIESQTPDLGSSQYVVTIRKKPQTTSQVKLE